MRRSRRQPGSGTHSVSDLEAGFTGPADAWSAAVLADMVHEHDGVTVVDAVRE